MFECYTVLSSPRNYGHFDCEERKGKRTCYTESKGKQIEKLRKKERKRERKRERK